ncbi:UDP-3-O-acylglucosamine N-acyltransferase [Planctomycetales bacterium 10988]|nr:UDP-3-O-acylglucosamine N-acyltransferase [Planctomycetales bacterium 10988]
MSKTLSELAQRLGGQLVGCETLLICDALPLKDAHPQAISFLDNPQHADKLASSEAAAFLVPADFTSDDPRPMIQVEHVQKAFSEIYQIFHPVRKRSYRGISSEAKISKTAKIGENVTIYPSVTIGEEVVIEENVVLHPGVVVGDGCRIGAGTELFANVVLYDEIQIGKRCLIHGGSIIGAYGFGYEMKDGKHQLIPQLGWVEIHDDVEIGSSVTIDRATYGATVIGEGSKIDNLVMIAHNCKIGKHNLICGQVGIAGSTSTGDYVVLAGQVGIRDHVHIGQAAVIGASSGVMTDIPPGTQYVGTPATPIREQMLSLANFQKLPEMRRQLKDLTRQVQRLTGTTNPRKQAS